MITEAELRQRAFAWGVDAMVVDLDYSLGWFLAAFYAANERANGLCFKGGTCLRKCYFGEYRFSEDLDFTATIRVTAEQLVEWTANASAWSGDHDGPSFEAAAPRIETVRDDYGHETYQARLYFRGPLQWGGSPRAIRLDVTRDEVMLLPADTRALIHPYSDAEFLQGVGIPCYSPVEILAEKLRAIGGQRRFTVSRDLYDIHHLIRIGVTTKQFIPLLARKFAAREVDLADLNIERLEARRRDFQEDWERRLNYLVEGKTRVDFGAAWETLMETVREMEAQSPHILDKPKEG